METRNVNRVSSKPGGPNINKEKKSLHEDNQVGKQSCQIEPSPSHCHLAGDTTNVTGGSECECSSVHSVEEETNNDSGVMVIDTPGSMSGEESVKEVGHDDQSSQDNALECMSGSPISGDQTKQNSRFCGINENFSSTLKSIYTKHGDITQNCSLQSECIKSFILSRICEVVQDLQEKQVKELSIASLGSYYTAVVDAENVNIDVLWLHKRLDEIKAAILFEEVRGLEGEKCTLLENIDKNKKEAALLADEIKRLKSKCLDIVQCTSNSSR